MNSSRASVVALLAGIAILFAGVVVGVGRAGGGSGTRVDEQRARLDSAEARIAAQPPRLEVNLAQIGGTAYEAATGASAADDDGLLGFSAVSNEVTERLGGGQASDQPDILALLRESAGRDPRRADFARMFAQARVINDGSTVVGLLVSRRDPGAPGTLRLDAYRLGLRDFRDVFDPTELLPATVSDFGIDVNDLPDGVTVAQPVSVEWESDPSGARQFVPLYVLHEFSVPDVPENAGVRNETGEPIYLQIATDPVLIPSRLFFRRADGQEIEIDIREALNMPIVLSAGTAAL
jgi:hypothetical protein